MCINVYHSNLLNLAIFASLLPCHPSFHILKAQKRCLCLCVYVKFIELLTALPKIKGWISPAFIFAGRCGRRYIRGHWHLCGRLKLTSAAQNGSCLYSHGMVNINYPLWDVKSFFNINQSEETVVVWSASAAHPLPLCLAWRVQQLTAIHYLGSILILKSRKNQFWLLGMGSTAGNPEKSQNEPNSLNDSLNGNIPCPFLKGHSSKMNWEPKVNQHAPSPA